MTGIAIITAIAALGIDYGWQPVAGGGVEYIIRLEPATLDALRNGEDIFSNLPADLSGVRSYRITTGTGPLPHHGQPPPVPRELPIASVPATPTTTSTLPPMSSGTAAGSPNLYTPPVPFDPPKWSDGMVQTAGGSSAISTTPLATPVPATTITQTHVVTPPASSEPEKPWITLTIVLLALFASLGANAYLGILGYGLHRRCRDLLGQLKMSP